MFKDLIPFCYQMTVVTWCYPASDKVYDLAKRLHENYVYDMVLNKEVWCGALFVLPCVCTSRPLCESVVWGGDTMVLSFDNTESSFNVGSTNV